MGETAGGVDAPWATRSSYALTGAGVEEGGAADGGYPGFVGDADEAVMVVSWVVKLKGWM